MPKWLIPGFSIAATFAVVIWIAGSNNLSPSQTLRSDDCVADFEEGKDYFPQKIAIRHAEAFTLSYHGHYKVVTIRSAPGSADPARDTMVLVQCGTPPPLLEGELRNATVITIPAHSVAGNEDLTLNRVRSLGHVGRVVAMGDGGVYAPELRQRWEAGQAVSIGASFHGAPDFEKLITIRPEVVFLSSASLGRAESVKRARQLGLPAVPSMSWMEPSVLGQAEWLHLVAAFLNAEETSISQFEQIRNRYFELSEMAQAQGDTPTIMWLDPGGQRDKWVVPQNNWIAQLVRDAGGRSLFAEEVGPPTRDVMTEQIFARGDEITAFVTTSVALAEPGSMGALEAAPAMQAKRLFDVHRRSRPEHDAYDWYESAVVEVDTVLADFVALMHPELLPDHEFRHLRKVR